MIKRIISHSKSLDAGHRSEIEEFEISCSLDLPGFRRGIMMARFQMSGKRPCAYERFKSLGRHHDSISL